MAKSDFESLEFKKLTWDQDTFQNSLDEIYKNVTDETDEIVEWYLKAKNKKKRKAIFIRSLVFILGTLGGVLPLLSGVLTNAKGASMIPPIFTTLFFALAAFFYGLDKFFGYSAGWMRYMKTQLYISSIEKSFKFNWEKQQVQYDKSQPYRPFVGIMLGLAADFSASVYEAIQQETDAWIKNFQGTFEELGKLTSKTSTDNS
jgi:hypothetical protein